MGIFIFLLVAVMVVGIATGQLGWGLAAGTVVGLIIIAVQKVTRAPSPQFANLPGPGLYAFDIVGESNYQDALEKICGGRGADSAEKHVDATIYLEDDNPHDDRAVRVEVDGMTIGYFARAEARKYRKQLEAQGHRDIVCTCKAVVTGGWSREGSEGSFGVRLDLPVQ